MVRSNRWSMSGDKFAAAAVIAAAEANYQRSFTSGPLLKFLIGTDLVPQIPPSASHYRDNVFTTLDHIYVRLGSNIHETATPSFVFVDYEVSTRHHVCRDTRLPNPRVVHTTIPINDTEADLFAKGYRGLAILSSNKRIYKKTGLWRTLHRDLCRDKSSEIDAILRAMYYCTITSGLSKQAIPLRSQPIPLTGIDILEYALGIRSYTKYEPIHLTFPNERLPIDEYLSQSRDFWTDSRIYRIGVLHINNLAKKLESSAHCS